MEGEKEAEIEGEKEAETEAAKETELETAKETEIEAALTTIARTKAPNLTTTKTIMYPILLSIEDTEGGNTKELPLLIGEQSETMKSECRLIKIKRLCD